MTNRQSFQEILDRCRELKPGEVQLFDPDLSLTFEDIITLCRAAAGEDKGITMDFHEHLLRARRTG